MDNFISKDYGFTDITLENYSNNISVNIDNSRCVFTGNHILISNDTNVNSKSSEDICIEEKPVLNTTVHLINELFYKMLPALKKKLSYINYNSS